MEIDATDLIAREEVPALALLLQGDGTPGQGRRVLVVAIAVERDGSSTMTTSPVDCDHVQLLGFAQGLERAAQRLRKLLPKDHDHA